MRTKSKQSQDPKHLGPRAATGSGRLITRRRLLAAGSAAATPALPARGARGVYGADVERLGLRDRADALIGGIGGLGGERAAVSL